MIWVNWHILHAQSHTHWHTHTQKDTQQQNDVGLSHKLGLTAAVDVTLKERERDLLRKCWSTFNPNTKADRSISIGMWIDTFRKNRKEVILTWRQEASGKQSGSSKYYLRSAEDTYQFRLCASLNGLLCVFVCLSVRVHVCVLWVREKAHVWAGTVDRVSLSGQQVILTLEHNPTHTLTQHNQACVFKFNILYRVHILSLFYLFSWTSIEIQIFAYCFRAEGKGRRELRIKARESWG